MIISTTEELRLYFPAHAIDHVESLAGYIDNSEHDFLLQPLGQPLYDKLTEYYQGVREQLPKLIEQLRQNNLGKKYYAQLLFLSQRCVAFDAIGRSYDQQAVSLNGSGLNFASAEDYKTADRDAKNDAKQSCVKEAHSSLNRLLYTLEMWTSQCPDAEDVTEETEELFEIVSFWRSSRYFYLAAQLLIPSAVVLQDYLNIYDSREKFIQMLPDLHFIQEEQIAPSIGEDFCDYLIAQQLRGGTKRDATAATAAHPKTLADDATINPVIRRLLHKLRKIMASLLEGRTTVIKVDKQRRIDARDEGVRLLGQFTEYCRQHQDDILTALGPEDADIYKHSPLYIDPDASSADATAASGNSHCQCKTGDFNGDDQVLHVTMPLL